MHASWNNFAESEASLINGSKEPFEKGPFEKDVHTEHCCAYCGCKYRDDNCTVVKGPKLQSFRCGETSACDPTNYEETRQKKIADYINQITAENDSLKDQLLRSKAELANTTKRLNEQHKKVIQYAHSGFALAMIGILDNLEKTQALIREAEADSISQGVKLVVENFTKELKTHGIEPIVIEEATPFDPNLHEALINEGGTSNLVVTKELQKGYKIYDRVLRHAKVAVKEQRLGGEIPDIHQEQLEKGFQAFVDDLNKDGPTFKPKEKPSLEPLTDFLQKEVDFNRLKDHEDN